MHLLENIPELNINSVTDVFDTFLGLIIFLVLGAIGVALLLATIEFCVEKGRAWIKAQRAARVKADQEATTGLEEPASSNIISRPTLARATSIPKPLAVPTYVIKEVKEDSKEKEDEEKQEYASPDLERPEAVQLPTQHYQEHHHFIHGQR